MSYLILKCTGKTNYSKVSMYCYIIMNFVSVYPSVDLDDYFVYLSKWEMWLTLIIDMEWGV